MHGMYDEPLLQPLQQAGSHHKTSGTQPQYISSGDQSWSRQLAPPPTSHAQPHQLQQVHGSGAGARGLDASPHGSNSQPAMRTTAASELGSSRVSFLVWLVVVLKSRACL